MSLFRAARAASSSLIPGRAGWAAADKQVTTPEAMRSSVIWAGLHLRASLVGMMPVDVYRTLPDGSRVPVPTPAVLREPDEYAEGKSTRISQWLYAAEMALGGWGNAVGIIHSTSDSSTPARVELVDLGDVVFRVKGTRVKQYRIAGEKVDPKYVWHERRHLLPGVPVGMSAITYAALALNGGLAAHRMLSNWFENQTIPAAWFKNTERVVSPADSAVMEARFEEKVKSGGTLITGKDWEYTPLQAKSLETAFLDAVGATDRDLCRYVGVPGDMIDVAIDGSSITYANITQRNLQLLTINLGPDIKDHEDALSGWVARPRFVKLNRNSLLAMDPKTRAEVVKLQIDARTLTPDEARRIDDREPLTGADYDQFDRLFGSKNTSPKEIRP